MVVNTIRQERERIEAMRLQEDEVKNQEKLRLLEKEKNRLESEVSDPPWTTLYIDPIYVFSLLLEKEKNRLESEVIDTFSLVK